MLHPTGSRAIALPNSTCRVRIRCAHRATRSVLWRSNAPWTSSRNDLTSIQWNCACATTRRPILSAIGPSPHAISPNVYVKALFALAGTSAVPKPASVSDGRWLIGLGVASAIRGDELRSATARARLTPDHRLIVELAMTDIGTGTYTILTQIAAEAMEMPVERVTVRMGDTNYPPTDGSGGSWGAATSGGAVVAACRKLKSSLASGVTEAGGSVPPAELSTSYSHAGFGAHFAEAVVHRDTGEVRVRRMLGIFAAGRILNPKTARSQMIGGMTWGLGSALMAKNYVVC